MSVKHFVLLLIFILNSAATALADSIHIEMEVYSAAVEHSADHHDTSKAPVSAEEDCPEHEACHSGHYHHYLTSEFIPSIGCAYSIPIGFSYPQSFYISNFIEITKPPLLHS